MCTQCLWLHPQSGLSDSSCSVAPPHSSPSAAAAAAAAVPAADAPVFPAYMLHLLAGITFSRVWSTQPFEAWQARHGFFAHISGRGSSNVRNRIRQRLRFWVIELTLPEDRSLESLSGCIVTESCPHLVLYYIIAANVSYNILCLLFGHVVTFA